MNPFTLFKKLQARRDARKWNRLGLTHFMTWDDYVNR